MTTFNAALMERSGESLRIAPVSIKNLADTDVIVRVKAASLCHTDLEAMRGDLRTPLPFVPGHEAAGIVEWTGSAVTKVTKGDHVVMSWNPHCAANVFIARGNWRFCTSRIVSRSHGGGVSFRWPSAALSR